MPMIAKSYISVHFAPDSDPCSINGVSVPVFEATQSGVVIALRELIRLIESQKDITPGQWKNATITMPKPFTDKAVRAISGAPAVAQSPVMLTEHDPTASEG